MKTMPLLLVLLALAGCDMITPPWKISSLRHTAKQPITCETGKDCDEKWERALQWVQRKSKFAIITQNDQLIKTADSTDLNSFVAFTIAKVAIDNTHYRIDYDASCDDDFGCTPTLLELKASFVEFVNGASPKIK